MKLVRPAIAVALCGSLVLVATAEAKIKPKPVKPVCNLTTDVAGDANKLPIIGTVGAGPAEPAFDITSIDVASNEKFITGAIRVVKLAKSAAASPTGIHWAANFTLNDTHYFLSASEDVGGTEKAELNEIDNPTAGTYKHTAPATAVFDLVKNELRISVKIKDAGLRVAPGKSVFSELGGNAGREYSAGGATAQDFTDEAVSDKSYKASTPSCVTIGK